MEALTGASKLIDAVAFWLLIFRAENSSAFSERNPRVFRARCKPQQTNVFIDRLAEAPWMRMPSQRIGEFQHSPRLDDKNLRILIAAGILPVASFDGRLVKRTTSALRWFGAAAAALIVMGTVAHSVRATITVSGNASPVYNSTDPWATTTLIVGNTAPGSMAVGAGSVVNNTGTGTVANIAAASTSAVSISGAGSKWTNTGEVHVGQSGAATLDIT